MKVTVEYLAQLRDAAGTASAPVDLPAAATVGQLLERLADTGDERLRRMLVDDAGRPRTSLMVFVDDRKVRPEHPLADGAVVLLGTPISGG